MARTLLRMKRRRGKSAETYGYDVVSRFKTVGFRSNAPAGPDWMGYLSWSASANRFGWSSLLGVPAGSDKVPEGAVPARVENLAGLPETFIGVGSIDLFVDEDIEYARRLIKAGVPTELFVLPGGYHGFQTDVPDAPDSKRFHAAVDRALERAFTQ